MYLKVAVLCFTACTFIQADKNDKKWVWGDNNRNGKSSLTNPISLDNKAEARYEVFEDDSYEPNFLPNQQRPIIGNRPPYRPPLKPSFVPNERPGGGFYGPQPEIGGDLSAGILTGPVPSWNKENQGYKEFDKCKCTEKFNCNGVAYGHCDIGKQYCCTSSKGLSGPPPSRPVYSAENGVLVGPGGPADRPVGGGNRYPRPGSFPAPGGNYPRPGGAGFGLGGNSGPFPSNGVLVGPGGPYDRPYNRPGGGYGGGGYGGGGYGGGYGIGRSSKKE